jgi:hypothetical protein
MKVQKEDIAKALGALQEIAKGHNSRGTATTNVETMSGEGGDSQVFHTSNDSDPGKWAGTSQSTCPEDGAHDDIEENGTDYDGKAKFYMAKSIVRKLEKGVDLTQPEIDFVSAGGLTFLEKGFGEDDEDDDKKVKKAGYSKNADKDKEEDDKPAFMKGKEDADDEDDDDKKPPFMKKSLSDHASDNDTVREGLEVSTFLAGWADVINKSNASCEERTVQRVISAQDSALEDIRTSFDSLAKAVVGLAEVVSSQEQRIDQVETTPARGPKSSNVQPIEKSFGDPSQASDDTITKSQVNETLFALLQDKKVTKEACLKFDATGQISPSDMDKVKAARAGNQ